MRVCTCISRWVGTGLNKQRQLAVVALCLMLVSCGDRWNRNFDPHKEGPHGTAMLVRLLAQLHPDAATTWLSDELELDTLEAQGQVYMAIGEGMPYDSVEVRRLKAFIAAGGTAFINAQELAIGLPRALLPESCLGQRYRLYHSASFDDEVAIYAINTARELVPVKSVVYQEEYYEYIALHYVQRPCYPAAMPLVSLLRVGPDLAYDPLDQYPAIDEEELEGDGILNFDPLETIEDAAYPPDDDSGDDEQQSTDSDGLDADDMRDGESSAGDPGFAEAPATEEEEADYEAASPVYEESDDYTSEPLDVERRAELPTRAQLANFPREPIPGAFPVLLHVPYGKGRLLLHSAPILLTNAYLAEPQARAYVETVLAYLPDDTKTLIVDTDRRAPAWMVAVSNTPKDLDQDRPFQTRESVLRELLSRPALRAAWYMLLAGAVMFVVLGARRRQRAVPVIHSPRNATLDYLGGVSRLYLAGSNNSLMANKEFAMFEAFCQRKFGLRPLTSQDDRALLLKIKGVDPDRIETLSRYYDSVERRRGLSNDSFVALLKVLRHVYTSLGRQPPK